MPVFLVSVFVPRLIFIYLTWGHFFLTVPQCGPGPTTSWPPRICFFWPTFLPPSQLSRAFPRRTIGVGMVLIHLPRVAASIASGLLTPFAPASTRLAISSPHIYRARAGVFDVDQFGHMNNAAYLVHCEMARWQLSAASGLLARAAKRKMIFLVGATAVRYRRLNTTITTKKHSQLRRATKSTPVPQIPPRLCSHNNSNNKHSRPLPRNPPRPCSSPAPIPEPLALSSPHKQPSLPLTPSGPPPPANP